MKDSVKYKGMNYYVYYDEKNIVVKITTENLVCVQPNSEEYRNILAKFNFSVM